MVAAPPRNRIARVSAPPAPLQARTPRTVRRLALGLVFFFALLVPVLVLAPWTQTVHGMGRAIAFDPVRRPQVIVSPIQGRVMKWHVKEGDRVRPGDKLVDLVDNDPRRLEMLREQRLLADERRTQTREMVDFQSTRLTNVEAEAPLRVQAARARMEQAEAAVPVVKQELLRAKADELRANQLYTRQKRTYDTPVAGVAQGGAVAKEELERAEQQLALAQARVPLVEAQITVAEKQFAAAAKDLEAIERQTDSLVQAERQALAARRSDLAAVDQQFQTINSEVSRQENQFVAAPTAGTIFRVLANAEAGGQLVNPGQQLAVLVPDIAAQGGPPAGSNLLAAAAAIGGPAALTAEATPGIVAELLIDGNDLPLVRKGDRTLVQFEGWAAVQFAAYPEAAAGTFEGRVYLVDPTSDGQGRFRILVEPAPGEPAADGKKVRLSDGRLVDPWPDEAFLRQGVRAQGWVLIQEVRLGYELWRLLNGFPPAREVKPKADRQVLGVGPVEARKGK